MLKIVLSIDKVGDKFEVVLKEVFSGHTYVNTIFMQEFDEKPSVQVHNIHRLQRKRVHINDMTFWVDELKNNG